MKQATKRHKQTSSLVLRLNKRLREGAFIMMSSLSIYLFIALFSFDSADPGWSHAGMSETTLNAAGLTGALVADVMLSLLGYIAYLFPLGLLASGWMIYRDGAQFPEFDPLIWVLRFLGFIVAIIACCGLISMHVPWHSMPMSAGGVLGAIVQSKTVNYLNYAGASIILLSSALAGITLFSGLSWLKLIDLVGHLAIKLVKSGLPLVKLKAWWQRLFKSSLNLIANPPLIRLMAPKSRNKKEEEVIVLPAFADIEAKKLKKNRKKSKSEPVASDFDELLVSQHEPLYSDSTSLTQNIEQNKPKSKVTAKIKNRTFSLIKWATKFRLKRPVTKSGGSQNHQYGDPDRFQQEIEQEYQEDYQQEVQAEVKTDPQVEVQAENQKQDQQEYMQSMPQTATMQPRAKPIKPKVARIKRPLKDTPKPSLSLLQEDDEQTYSGFSEEDLQLLAHLVEQRLLEFGVEVKVVNVHPGPVITRFELDLAAGIKVSKISGLAKDLARSLSVVSVRVVEVIPGKPVVGLEIPNSNREIVRLKDVLSHQTYQDAVSPLSLGLGKDISGRPVMVDLARMPHLLVAGTTGSGKSVGINAMLLSILYKASPQEVRLILIDPKMLELAVYHDIPHLLTPVVTDMKEATNALRWCVAEMERRYQLMAAVGVRNVTGLNQKIIHGQKHNRPILDPLWNPQLSNRPDELEFMPYIVVVIDEFADMIMVLGKKAEELIARIAQKARAAGIHLIIATQRPSVDVITGLIKANIPTRIAFQVSSKIDSRTILDQMGAEQLLGQGDMLYLPPGVGVPHRIHGAFVEDDEVHSVCDELRLAGPANYEEDILAVKPRGMSLMDDGDELDDFFDEAVMIVTESRKASISLIQRRLKIGYNRAARLVEQMEAHGIVSAVQSNGTREVLAGPAQVS